MLSDSALPVELEVLWHDVCHAAEESCLQHGDVGAIRKGVEYLRHQYVVEKLDGPPRFDDEATRLAYGIAYHPAHAFAYLHILTRRSLGRDIFGGFSRSPKVLVLGAGLGAETLASIRWLELNRPELLKGARFILVDRAPWNSTRRRVLTPTVRDSWSKHKIVFDEVTSDLGSIDGEQFLDAEVGRADVIFCPSVLSEMISEQTQDRLLQSLSRNMSLGTKLVLFDHKDPEFEHVSRQFSRQFEVVAEGMSTGVVIPRPHNWTLEKILDGGHNRIPARSYPMMWSVLRRV